MGTPLQLLGLSALTLNALTRAGITTIEGLDRWSDDDLLSIKNFGRRSLGEARAAVARWHGKDYVERIARYLRWGLLREHREQLAALLVADGSEKDALADGKIVPAVGQIIAYFDHQAAGTVDPRAVSWIQDQVRPSLERIRAAVEAAEASLDRALRADGDRDSSAQRTGPDGPGVA